MAAGTSGQSQSRDDRQRFKLPNSDIEPGRSQPKRLPPRRDGNSSIARRIAWSVATFVISLGTVSVIYGLLISPDFRSVSLENGTTAAIALLIGCFALPAERRIGLSPRDNLLVCLTVVAITPWTYQLGNRLEDAGMDLATGFNFVFEVLLAVLLYRIASRRTKRPE